MCEIQPRALVSNPVKMLSHEVDAERRSDGLATRVQYGRAEEREQDEGQHHEGGPSETRRERPPGRI
jgi:hypothetical protein